MSILATLKGAGLATKAFAIANGPTILFAGGLVVGAIAIGSAIHDAVTKSTDDLEDAVDDIHAANELLKNPGKETDISEVKAAKRSSVGRFLKTLFKLYGKTLALAIISALLLAGGFYWQSKRFAIASAAAASTAAVLSTVDNNIKNLFGEEGVRAMHDPNFDPEAFKAKAAANGKAEAIEAVNDEFKQYVPSGIKVPGDWIFEFSPSTAKQNYWKDTARDNALTIVGAQGQLNRLKASHDFYYVTVNMALKWLGLNDEYDSPSGDLFGWGLDDYIDFGVDELLANLERCSMIDDYNANLFSSKYNDKIFLRFNNVRYLTENIRRGGRDLQEVVSI